MPLTSEQADKLTTPELAKAVQGEIRSNLQREAIRDWLQNLLGSQVRETQPVQQELQPEIKQTPALSR